MVIYKNPGIRQGQKGSRCWCFRVPRRFPAGDLESPRIAHCNPECVIVTYGFHGYCRVGFSIVCHVGKKRSVPGGSGSN